MKQLTEQKFSPDAVDAQASYARTDESPMAQGTLRVLFVGADDHLGRSRALLLESLGWPVDVTRNRAGICALPREARYALVAVGLSPRLVDGQLILTTIRSLWPAARILLLGNSAVGIEDYQYDEMVNADHHPSYLVDVAARLISAYASTSRT